MKILKELNSGKQAKVELYDDSDSWNADEVRVKRTKELEELYISNGRYYLEGIQVSFNIGNGKLWISLVKC
jgi:hypothetical protein